MKLRKMKKPRSYSQWKEQDKSPERTNSETDLISLLDPVFKKEVIKMLKELKNIMDRMQITLTRN